MGLFTNTFFFLSLPYIKISNACCFLNFYFYGMDGVLYVWKQKIIQWFIKSSGFGQDLINPCYVEAQEQEKLSPRES